MQIHLPAVGDEIQANIAWQEGCGLSVNFWKFFSDTACCYQRQISSGFLQAKDPTPAALSPWSLLPAQAKGKEKVTFYKIHLY